MNKPRPGVRYHAAMATTAAGEMALAIAHKERGEPVLDAVRVTTVAGGEAGIDAVYRGLREEGLEIIDCRKVAGADRSDAPGRAIADVLALARARTGEGQ